MVSRPRFAPPTLMHSICLNCMLISCRHCVWAQCARVSPHATKTMYITEAYHTPPAAVYISNSQRGWKSMHQSHSKLETGKFYIISTSPNNECKNKITNAIDNQNHIDQNWFHRKNFTKKKTHEKIPATATKFWK